MIFYYLFREIFGLKGASRPQSRTERRAGLLIGVHALHVIIFCQNAGAAPVRRPVDVVDGVGRDVTRVVINGKGLAKGCVGPKIREKAGQGRY